MVNIVITGFMCTGKTSVGMSLAKRLNFEYIDTDEIIEQRLNMKISDIFSQYGELYFRDIETQVVKEVSQLDNKVISTGGGVVLRKENMDNLRKNGFIVNLTASPEVIYERLKTQPGIRPLLNKPNPFEEIKKLLSFREEYYKNCDIRINTDSLSVEEVVEEIIRNLKLKKVIE